MIAKMIAFVDNVDINKHMSPVIELLSATPAGLET